MIDTGLMLASCCNLPFRKKSVILALRLSPGPVLGDFNIEPVRMGFPGLLKSATGMTCGEDRIFAAVSPWKKNLIIIMDSPSLQPVNSYELEEVQDVHSILYFESGLYVVSTGTDEILRYEITSKGALTNPTVIWAASETKTDTHHVNSIIQKDGELIISAFGEKAGSSWKTAREGYILNLSTGRVLKKGIAHPHSLSVKAGRIFYCSSQEGSFFSLDDDEPIFRLDGYTRGVTWLSDEHVCVAVSTRHKVPKLGWLKEKALRRDNSRGLSQIILGNIRTREIAGRIDLSFFAPEIYDLLNISASVDG